MYWERVRLRAEMDQGFFCTCKPYYCIVLCTTQYTVLYTVLHIVLVQ